MKELYKVQTHLSEHQYDDMKEYFTTPVDEVCVYQLCKQLINDIPGEKLSQLFTVVKRTGFENSTIFEVSIEL